MSTEILNEAQEWLKERARSTSYLPPNTKDRLVMDAATAQAYGALAQAEALQSFSQAVEQLATALREQTAQQRLTGR